MLLRYGFSFEDFHWLKQIVKEINESGIIFDDLSSLSTEQFDRIKKFI